MAGKRTADPAIAETMEEAKTKGINTVFDRAESTKPCPIGHVGNCCKSCFMGPCRLTGKTEVGVCGATKATVAARNFAMYVAAGAAAHSDHGRDMTLTLLAAAEGTAPDYKITDEKKLHRVAEYLGVSVEGRPKEEIAKDVAIQALLNFGSQMSELSYIKRAPQKRQQIWRQLGIVPRGIDREVSELMHRINPGTDQEPEHILRQCLRTGLADGWGGSMLSTDISDILFGTPGPVAAKANLGVLSEDQVNVVIHGHEPTLSMMIVEAANDPEIIEYAKSKGAAGVNLAGICCTANEVLMRHGVGVLGNFLSQELALVTGAVDAMVVDIQCVMEGLVAVAARYHTKLITTSPKAKVSGATHIEFNEHRALEVAKEIVRMAIDNYPNRKEVHIPGYVDHLIAGFSHEYISYMQGGIFRESFRPLNDNIANGRIRGAAGVVGCNNARVCQDDSHNYIVKELIKNDVLVVTTGCDAIACAKGGLLTPEVMKLAGPGLKEVCQAIGIPPVLHMGSCVDNSRILTVLTQCATEGGLGDDISDLPAVGICPEWMSEKAISIACYAVASGVKTIFGVGSPVAGSEEVTKLIGEGWTKQVGAGLYFEPDPEKIVQMALEHIDAKRRALKLEEYNPAKYAQSDAYLPGDYGSFEEFTKGSYSRVGAK